MSSEINPEGKVVFGYDQRISRFAARDIEKIGGVAAGARTNASAEEVEKVIQTLTKVVSKSVNVVE